MKMMYDNNHTLKLLLLLLNWLFTSITYMNISDTHPAPSSSWHKNTLLVKVISFVTEISEPVKLTLNKN